MSFPFAIVVINETIRERDQCNSKNLINRNLPKVNIQNAPFTKQQLDKFNTNCPSDTDKNYFIYKGTIKNLAYDIEKYPINIKTKAGEVANIISLSDHLNLENLTRPVIKHFAYYPKL